MSRDHEQTVAHGRRIVESAETSGLPARMVGGAGVWHSLDPARRPAYESVRPVPRDVDLLLPPKSGRAIGEVMTGLGFVGDERLNALRGDQRQCWFLLGDDGDPILDVDIFVGHPPLCHKIDFTGQLAFEGPSMTVTDLLLQKIQIVEINQKDLVDAAYLILDRGVTDDPDGEGAIVLPRITELLAADWGFFYTATRNLERIAAASTDFLAPEQSEAVASGTARLVEAAEAAPKSFKWRMRAKVGTKSQWYEDVEEVER